MEKRTCNPFDNARDLRARLDSEFVARSVRRGSHAKVFERYAQRNVRQDGKIADQIFRPQRSRRHNEYLHERYRRHSPTCIAIATATLHDDDNARYADVRNALLQYYSLGDSCGRRNRDTFPDEENRRKKREILYGATAFRR